MNEPQPGDLETGVKHSAAGRRAVWLLLPVVLLGLAGAYEWSLNGPKTWRAEAQLEILPHPPPAALSPLDGVPPPPAESLETQVALIQSREMARRTLMAMKNEALVRGQLTDTIPFTADQIQKAIRVTNPPGTTLLVVTAAVTDPWSSSPSVSERSATQAKQLAEAVARAFVSWRQEDAQKEMAAAATRLEREADKAQLAMIRAERVELTFKLAHLHPTVTAKDTAARGPAKGFDPPIDPQVARLQEESEGNILRQNTEITMALYRRLLTALFVTRLQRDAVPDDVRVIEGSVVLDAPQS